MAAFRVIDFFSSKRTEAAFRLAFVASSKLVAVVAAALTLQAFCSQALLLRLLVFGASLCTCGARCSFSGGNKDEKPFLDRIHCKHLACIRLRS